MIALAVFIPGVALGGPGGAWMWSQVGGAMDGSASGDRFGETIAMNADGNVVAVAARVDLSHDDDRGQVRVYRVDGASWNQLGDDIYGDSVGDLAGRSLAIDAAGVTIAIGSPQSLEVGARGYVRVYHFDGSHWNQVGGDIVGEAAGDQFGRAVAMSADGRTVVAGARLNRTSRGHARVYGFDGADWAQIGSDIETTARLTGSSVAMSADGGTVVVGAPNSASGDRDRNVGVFRLDGSDWSQLGDYLESDQPIDQFGDVVAMSADGNRVAVGAWFSVVPLPRAGYVRVLEFDGANWIQLGADIDGEAAFDRSGQSVAMSADGATVAIGAPFNDGGGENAGHVRVLEFDGATWIEIGNSIDGEARLDLSGWSVGLNADGTRVAVGAFLSDVKGDDSGQVRVFELESIASPPLIDGDVVLFRNAASRRFLDGDGVRRSWNVDTSPEAKWDAGWRLSERGDGTWSLLNRRRTRYLDADGRGSDWNVAQSVNIKDDDRWEFIEQDDGSFTLRNVAFDRYLAQAGDDKNVITVAGADIDSAARWIVIDPT